MGRPSDSVVRGDACAPQRSLFYALGLTEEELNQPLIGVVSAYSEIVPGHLHLDKITEAVKAGIRMAGGTPIMVPSIGVCDGIAMGHIGMKYSLAVWKRWPRHMALTVLCWCQTVIKSFREC